jgi:hypothetical protein
VLEVCVLLRAADPPNYERGALRWVGRLCLENRGLTLSELNAAVEAFNGLSD